MLSDSAVQHNRNLLSRPGMLRSGSNFQFFAPPRCCQEADEKKSQPQPPQPPCPGLACTAAIQARYKAAYLPDTSAAWQMRQRSNCRRKARLGYECPREKLAWRSGC